MSYMVEIKEALIVPGAKPWTMTLSRNSNYCDILVRGFLGGKKVYFTIFFDQLLKAVERLKEDN